MQKYNKIIIDLILRGFREIERRFCFFFSQRRTSQASLLWLAGMNLSGRWCFIAKAKMRSFTNFSVVINNEEMKDSDLIVCAYRWALGGKTSRIILMLVKRRLYYINGATCVRSYFIKTTHCLLPVFMQSTRSISLWGPLSSQQPTREGFQDSFVKIWKVILEFLIRLIKNSWIIFPSPNSCAEWCWLVEAATTWY